MKKMWFALAFSCIKIVPLCGAESTAKQSDLTDEKKRALARQNLEGTVQYGPGEVTQKKGDDEKGDDGLKNLLNSFPICPSQKKEPYEEVFMVHGNLYKIIGGKIVPIAVSSKLRRIKTEEEELP